MIQAVYDERNHSITMQGHAGAAPAGNDIVCAAASILMWTLMAAVQGRPELHAHAQVNEMETVMAVRCSPEEDSEQACRALYEAFWGGFELLEDHYPDNVKTERSKEWQR